ncbi:hypothetical protein CBL_09851 [Carabus blaptoides fortunei]
MSVKCFFFLALVSTASCLLVPLNVKITIIELTISVLNIDVLDLSNTYIKSFTKNPLLSEILPTGLLPYDDGSSNFGDLIHLQKGLRDVLVYSEVLTNDPCSDSETNVQWSGRFPGYMVTQVRVLNVGRQRAFCSFIGSGSRLNSWPMPARINETRHPAAVTMATDMNHGKFGQIIFGLFII